MIVVVVNQFINIIRLKTTITVVLSEKIAKIYRDNIWKIHRVSKKIHSNRESQFVSWFIEDLYKALETKKTSSMGYYF